MVVKNLTYNHLDIEVEPGVMYQFKAREEKSLDDKYIHNLMIKDLEKEGAIKIG